MADNFDPSQLAALLQQHPELMQSLGQFHPSSAPISDNPDVPVQKPGFLQSIGNALSGNPMLQSAAHPKTAGDIASLLLPSGAMGAVAPARGIQAGIDGTKAVDTGAGIIAKVNQFGGDRSVRGVGGLHVEAPGGMSSITPEQMANYGKAQPAADMGGEAANTYRELADAKFKPFADELRKMFNSPAKPEGPSISMVEDPAAAHRDLLIQLMQRKMGTGPNLADKFTQSNALETALAKERQAANMASRTR